MDVQKRIEQLERERWLYLALAVLGALAGVAGAGLAALKGGGHQTVTAQSFIVQDDAGRQRAIFGFDSTGALGLQILDRTAKASLHRLGLTPNGEPFITLSNLSNLPQAELSITRAGNPRLALFDTNGKLREQMTLDKDKVEALLQIFDGEGRPQLSASGGPIGGRLLIADPATNKTSTLTPDFPGRPAPAAPAAGT